MFLKIIGAAAAIIAIFLLGMMLGRSNSVDHCQDSVEILLHEQIALNDLTYDLIEPFQNSVEYEKEPLKSLRLDLEKRNANINSLHPAELAREYCKF